MGCSILTLAFFISSGSVGGVRWCIIGSVFLVVGGAGGGGGSPIGSGMNDGMMIRKWAEES